jgi:putative component of membrane protein insertase Oxa1/YidC/SpoIIIJ protein YidD
MLVQLLAPLEGVANVANRLGLRPVLDLTTLTAVRRYQKHVSPYKGFSCAHRRLYGQESCSQYFRKMVATQGLAAAIPLFQQRLQDCHQANLTMRGRYLATANPDREPDPDSEEEPQRRQRREGSGNDACLEGCTYVDCSNLIPNDFSSCDHNRSGSLDCGDCYAPSFDVPDCSTIDCSGCDASGCGDCGSCGGG